MTSYLHSRECAGHRKRTQRRTVTGGLLQYPRKSSLSNEQPATNTINNTSEEWGALTRRARSKRQRLPGTAPRSRPNRAKWRSSREGTRASALQAAKKVVEHDATVVLVCRSEVLGKQAQLPILEHVKNLRSELSATERDALPPPRIKLILLNLGSFASIHKFTDEFHDSFDHLDLLINNAGLSFPGKGATKDGLDIEFGVNHISHFYLTKLLINSLEKSSSARVVTVSSLQHRNSTVAFYSQGHLVEESDYAVSKLTNLMFGYELERRLCATNVISVAVRLGVAHTAVIDKYLDAHIPRMFHWFFNCIVLKFVAIQDADLGALPTLYAGIVEDVQSLEFYGPKRKERTGYPVRTISFVESYDEGKAKKLWKRSEELIKCKSDV